ncbi:BlaI/MecI/CopY family transcriptional regulator [Streptomyces sp. NPDC059783]|uniref:BlaI/MecI/CopY family transcriptional regulator n=1 Tax=Streptomyces sp. NPDC059783 TaxID=3346944 RepID=UPI00365FA803
MADEPAKTPIQSKYAQQYAKDLAANRKEQGDIIAQIAGFKERLGRLQTEENWLTQALDSLPGAPVPSEPEAEAPSAGTVEPTEASALAEAAADAPQAVPTQRQADAESEKKSKPAQKTAAAKKTTARKAAKKTTAKPAAKKTTAKAAKKPPAVAPQAPTDKAAAEVPSEPPLWELVLGILLKTPGQPCVAREVHDQLAQDHPDRATSIQTVRNNLETLVKKGHAEKSTQQRNAMYTAYADAAPAADSAAGDETGQALEAVAEKVSAEV